MRRDFATRLGKRKMHHTRKYPADDETVGSRRDVSRMLRVVRIRLIAGDSVTVLAALCGEWRGGRDVGLGRREAAQASAYLQCHRVTQLQGTDQSSHMIHDI